MKIKYVIKKATPKEFNELAESVGWSKRKDKDLKVALANTLFMICAYDGEKIVGIGRIVGDGAIVLHICSIIVRKEYQGKKIGTNIMQHLLKYINKIRKRVPEIKVSVGADKGKETFYMQFGFVSRLSDNLGESLILK